MDLTYLDLQFTLRPEKTLYWPRSMRGTVLRGAFGTILKEVACDPLCSGVQCRFSDECAYHNLFAPTTPPDAARLSLNQDLPRPFVMEADPGGPEMVAPGGDLHFTMRLFGKAVTMYPYIIVVFSELSSRGFGRDRTPCSLVRVMAGEDVVYESRTLFELKQSAVGRLDLSLACSSDEKHELEILFQTPTYLKDGGREVTRAREAFGALVRRGRDRLSSLAYFYGEDHEGGPIELPWDFRALGDLANRAELVVDEMVWSQTRRRSSRTGQVQDLSGLTGRACYRGVPGILERLLQLASVTHVGKHAAFGLGKISVRRLNGATT